MKVRAIVLLVSVALLCKAQTTATFRAKQSSVAKIWAFVKKPVATITYTLGSGATDATGKAVLDMSIATNRLAPAGLQWEMSYSAADVASLVAVAGPVSTAAGKDVTCASIGDNRVRCLVSGLNANAIGNGVAARVTVQTQTGSAAATSTITLSNVVTSGKSAQALTSVIAPGGGRVRFRVALANLNCPQQDIEPGEEAARTASLSPATVTALTGQSSTPVVAKGR